MAHTCNTNCGNSKFDAATIKAVWLKRKKEHPWGSNWGYDIYGSSIKWEEYGNISSAYGWDIDHSKPVSAKGTDHPNNLQPMQWRNNRIIKADNYPWTEEQHMFRLRQLQRK